MYIPLCWWPLGSLPRLPTCNFVTPKQGTLFGCRHLSAQGHRVGWQGAQVTKGWPCSKIILGYCTWNIPIWKLATLHTDSPYIYIYDIYNIHSIYIMCAPHWQEAIKTHPSWVFPKSLWMVVGAVWDCENLGWSAGHNREECGWFLILYL